MFSINPEKMNRCEFSAAELPALTGSEKQIAWATEIRQSRGNYLANQFDTIFNNARNAGKITFEQKGEALAQWTAKNTAEMSKTSAATWVSSR